MFVHTLAGPPFHYPVLEEATLHTVEPEAFLSVNHALKTLRATLERQASACAAIRSNAEGILAELQDGAPGPSLPS